MRLRGGNTPLEGQVQVLRVREWGTIGTNQWDLQDASVVCRQLGVPRAKVSYPEERERERERERELIINPL